MKRNGTEWRFVHRSAIVATASLLMAFSGPGANAQTDYPNRPIRMMTPVPAGGSIDAMTRLVSEQLRLKWGQPVVVENRPGANGNIGLSSLHRAEPDGHTFLFGPGAHIVVNKILYKNLGFDIDELDPVSRVATNPLVLVVHPSVPAKTLKDFIAYAKANPKKLNYASAGNGGMPHLGAEMFEAMAGVEMVRVTYKGVAPAMIGLVAGQVDLIFVDISTAIAHIRSGKLRVLGVASQNRHPVLPDTPALTEFFPGFTAETWFALTAPPKTPSDILTKVSTAVAEAIKLPELKEQFEKMGNIEAIGSTPAEMASFIAEERKRWGGVIQKIGMRND